MATGVFKKFYNSKEWKKFRQSLIDERGVICERCHKVITDSSKLHGHHKIELTVNNIFDFEVTLNPDKVELICKDCHDKEHERFGYRKQPSKDVIIVYGPPCSGKTGYVLEHKGVNDIVVDMDRLYEAITLLPRYHKPDRLKANVLSVRQTLIDNIRTRYGEYERAWVIGGYPNSHDRDRLARDLNADLICMDTPKHECIARLYACDDDRRYHIDEWVRYIEKWFDGG